MMAPGNYRPDGSPIIGISPHRLTGQGGITNTLDLGAEQKIQDYLAGAGVSTQGPGGGTLYTAGGGTAAGGGTIPQGNAPDLGQGIHNRFNNNRGPNIDPGRYPTFGNANLGFGFVENPLGPAGPGVGGVIPGSAPAEMAFPETDNQINSMPNNYNENLSLLTQPGPSFDNMFLPLFGEQEQQPGGGISNEVEQTPVDSFGIGSNPIINNPIAPIPSMPTAPNTQPGHSHDDLLAGIGKLFEQYFPQQGSQQINQPSPMFDAAGNSVPDGQTQSSQVFGNMITPNFGGGY